MADTNVKPYKTYLLFYRLLVANIMFLFLVGLIWTALYSTDNLPKNSGGAITFFNVGVALAFLLTLVSGAFASARKNLIKYSGPPNETNLIKGLAIFGRVFFIFGIASVILILIYIIWAIYQPSFWDSLK